jgi:hypothetical protein
LGLVGQVLLLIGYTAVRTFYRLDFLKVSASLNLAIQSFKIILSALIISHRITAI